MNAIELADYLINHDCESIIINRQYEYVQELVHDENLDIDFDTILEALDIANEDPYIILMATIIK